MLCKNYLFCKHVFLFSWSESITPSSCYLSVFTTNDADDARSRSMNEHINWSSFNFVNTFSIPDNDLPKLFAGCGSYRPTAIRERKHLCHQSIYIFFALPMKITTQPSATFLFYWLETVNEWLSSLYQWWQIGQLCIKHTEKIPNLELIISSIGKKTRCRALAGY